MKTTRQQRRTTAKSSANLTIDTGIYCTRAKTSTKKAVGQKRRAMGKSDSSLVEKDKNPSTSSVLASCQQLLVKETVLPETQNNMSSVELQPGKTPKPSAKIKLQLFPIDEPSRIGLEKEGHNPYLELTLRAQKKISSVIKHLNSKWGNSNMAVGELMLFPYSIHLENLATDKRWTLKDSDTSATDVYTAIGRPTIFRLRYGWFSHIEPKTFSLPPPPTFSRDCSLSEDVNKDFTTGMKTSDGEKQPCEENPQPGNGLLPSSIVWDEGLTNISIGGMLSEGSPQSNANLYDPVPTGSGPFVQQISFSCDSFDAAIAAHIYKHSQGPSVSSHGSRSSILDAEETCHAFPFQKLSSSGGVVPSSFHTAPSAACGQDADSEPFKCINMAEVRDEAGLPQHDACQETKSDLPIHTQADNGESSLGFTGINWTDSLGPLDFGLSSSRQIISGDSISISGLLGSSLDAFKSGSLFARDQNVPPT